MTSPDVPGLDRSALDDSYREWVQFRGSADQGAAYDLLRSVADSSVQNLQTKAAGVLQAFTAARSKLDQALDSEPKLFPDHNTDPVALLPVRIETIWYTIDGQYPAAAGHPPTLRVRVYPDDVCLSHLDTTLTSTEAAAGAQYWAAPGQAAWQSIQQSLRPDRAAWAVQATRPGAPSASVRADGTDRPPGSVSLMPACWRFVALTDGNVVADVTGRPIPDPLPIDVLTTDTSWAVSWHSALNVGMGIELSLPDGVDHVDQLFVVGLRNDAAGSGAAALSALLDAHAFSAGLAFLPAGTPTNNTEDVKSGWSSAPDFPDPNFQPAAGAQPRADALVAALGLGVSGALDRCTGAGDTEPEAVAALSMLTWPTLGGAFASGAGDFVEVNNTGTGGQVARAGDPAPWGLIRDHLLAHVRSRGPLPTLRIGHQPYGVLPVSGLDDWQPQPSGGADTVLLPWLKIAREFWRGNALGKLPAISAVTPERPLEQVLEDLLTRSPTAVSVSLDRLVGPKDSMTAMAGGGPRFPVALPGPEPNRAIWWTTASAADSTPASGNPDLSSELAGDHTSFNDTVTTTADFFLAVAAFLTNPNHTAAAAEYNAAWPRNPAAGQPRARRITLVDVLHTVDGANVLSALTSIENWSSLPVGQDALTQAFRVIGVVDLIVIDIVDNNADRTADIARAGQWVPELRAIERGLRAVAAIPLPRLCDLLAEVIDVYTFRLDAWITSLASSRLAELRATSPTGIRIGAYGWVENLAPMAARSTVPMGPGVLPAIVSEQDGYIHAPSLQQACSAAVLRSGALTHPGQPAYSIDLSSRRARTARWLVAGIQQGQTLGALLGYRFERALHDAQLDDEVAAFRRRYPGPHVADSDADIPAVEAVAARNVVDGLRIARDPKAATVAANPTAVGPLIEDLQDALDAVGDLLLAESVHHLVAGNPHRAGKSAAGLGQASDVPDTFDTLTTPHRARALTTRLAAVLPAATQATGWPLDDLSRLAPEIDAWIGHLLGPATGWSLTVTVGSAAANTVTADHLGLGALSTIIDAATAGNIALRRAAATLAGAPAGTPVQLSGDAWNGLQGMALRIRGLLAGARAVTPSDLPGRPIGTVDVAALQQRLATYAESSGRDGQGDLARAAADSIADPDAWLSNSEEALRRTLGTKVPLLTVWNVAAPTPHVAATPGEVDAWLIRYAHVRDVARGFYDTLLLSGLRGRRCEAVYAGQDPPDPAASPPTPEAWVGATYGAATRPRAASHLVWHQPLPVTGALVGIVFDEWAEKLPGADQIRQVAPGVAPLTSPPESELTGVAFHYDRPDAKAPQAVLVAVPPNLQRGWTSNSLVQVLRETLELGKLRGADTTDLAALSPVLPAIRIPAITTAAGPVLTCLPNAPARDLDSGPITIVANYRTPDNAGTGLTARVHDPLWMFTRQWQFGEFAAQDAASPAFVRLTGTSQRLNAWRPAGASAWTAYDPVAAPLDPMVEAEPEPDMPDMRDAVEAGAHYRILFAEAASLGDQPLQLAGLDLSIGEPDASTVGLIGAVGAVVPDPDLIQTLIGSGELEQSGLGALADGWSKWYAGSHPNRGPDCLDPNRLEYSADISIGGTVLHTDGYLGDGLDWYDLDIVPGASGAAADLPYTFIDEGVPSVVHYSGLPADRFWEMEDAAVDLGATTATRLDTGTLMLISFATIYGNDWYLTPLEVPVGSLTTLDQMLVHDVFDRTHLLDRAGKNDPTWAMYTLDSSDPSHPAASGLLILPNTSGVVGQPLEQVTLARDEMANLAWAIQHRITDGRGEPLDCRASWLAHRPPPAAPGPLPAYRVQTEVPDYWFPLVPIAANPGVVQFTRGQMATADPTSGPPTGRFIKAMSWLHDEEVPREGAALTRRAVLARWFDGSYYAWVRRQKSIGTGGSNSGLQFDSVWPTDPWPY